MSFLFSVVSLLTVFVIFLFKEEAVPRVKCEKAAEQAVLSVEMKTEVEEDSDQLENQVRANGFIELPEISQKVNKAYKCNTGRAAMCVFRLFTCDDRMSVHCLAELTHTQTL
jgi:hypothetical protein